MNRLEQSKKYLKYWQEKLNLSDWNLSAQLTDFNRTDFEQTGDVKVDLKNKSAIIFISKKDTGKDLNKVILHELVHLLLWEIDHYAEKQVKDKKEYLSLLEKTVSGLTEKIYHKSHFN